MAKEPCLVCGFLHPPAWDCPEMSIEVNIRLALDRLRFLTDQDPERLAHKRAFLQQKLAQLQSRQLLAALQGCYPGTELNFMR